MSQTSHDLDLLCWMVGDPVRVTALAANQLHAAEIEDIVSAAVLFRSGAMASLQLSINAPKGYSTRQIQGDEGTIVVPNVQGLTGDEWDRILVGRYENLGRAVGSRTGTHEQPPVTWRRVPLPGPGRVGSSVLRFLRRVGLAKKGPPKGHAVLLDRFIDAVLDGSEPVVSGESAVNGSKAAKGNWRVESQRTNSVDWGSRPFRSSLRLSVPGSRSRRDRSVVWSPPIASAIPASTSWMCAALGLSRDRC